MTIDEARVKAAEIIQTLAGVITVACPVFNLVTQEEAARVVLKMEERGYSLVPTNLIVRNHELSLEMQEKHAYNNSQKDTIMRGQAARIAQLEALLGVEKEEPEDKNPPIMWISNRESA